MIRSTRLLAVVLSVFWASGPAAAQSGSYWWECPGCGRALGLSESDGFIGPYSTSEQCERARSAAIPQLDRLEASGSANFPIVGYCDVRTGRSSGGGGGGITPPGSSAQGIVRALGLGTALGILGGSVQYDNDKDRMVNWGMVGGGAGGIAGSLLNARNLGATGTAVATGAFAAVAAAGVSKNRQLDGEPDTLKHDVALAAAAGAAGGWGLGKVAKSLTTRIRVPEGMDVGVTRRQFWLKWIW